MLEAGSDRRPRVDLNFVVPWDEALDVRVIRSGKTASKPYMAGLAMKYCSRGGGASAAVSTLLTRAANARATAGPAAARRRGNVHSMSLPSHMSQRYWTLRYSTKAEEAICNKYGRRRSSRSNLVRPVSENLRDAEAEDDREQHDDELES